MARDPAFPQERINNAVSFEDYKDNMAMINRNIVVDSLIKIIRKISKKTKPKINSIQKTNYYTLLPKVNIPLYIFVMSDTGTIMDIEKHNGFFHIENHKFVNMETLRSTISDVFFKKYNIGEEGISVIYNKPGYGYYYLCDTLVVEFQKSQYCPRIIIAVVAGYKSNINYEIQLSSLTKGKIRLPVGYELLNTLRYYE